MNKKIIISIIVMLIGILIGIGIWDFNLKNNSVTENNSNYNNKDDINNIVNISEEDVIDDCINEWSDYAEIIDEYASLANNDIINEETRYLAKDVNGYIFVYYLDDFNNETLYKETDISTEYLSVEDLDDLEIGIEVKGSKELNQLLEDFE